MIELKNSKIQYLGQASGRERYALDAFIGAVQMREPGGHWQDIRPRLVRDGDGWHIEGAPYYAEIKDDGARLFCPYKNERNSYLRLPAPALFDGLARNIVRNAARLDGVIVPNQITMPAEWGEIRITFSNTGMHFEILFTKAPPPPLFGKDSPRILLDAETAGIDIEQLLKSREGTGIPPPRLLAPELSGGGSQEHWLEWSYKDGQMELGFDFGDLAFPILLKNTTIDVQVGASENDGYVETPSTFNSNNSQMYLGHWATSSLHGFMRFTGVMVSGTIDVSYLLLYGYGYYNGSPQMKIRGVDEDNPAAPTTYAEFDTDPLTSAGVDWDAAFSGTQWYTSPSINSVIQELVDSYTISNDAIMFQVRDDAGSGSNYNGARTWDYSDHSYAPKIHIEYSSGGATAKTSAETGAGAEGRLLQVALSRTETAGATDSRQSLLAGLVRNESGIGIEQSLLTSFVAKLSAETGSGLEMRNLVASLIRSEVGYGVDTGGIPGQKNIFGGDVGTGYDALKALIGTSGAVTDMKLPGRLGQVKMPSKGVSL